MTSIGIQEPISSTVADAVFGAILHNERQFDEAVAEMLHSPLPWDVILLMGIYDYAKTTGVDLQSMHENTKNEIAERLAPEAGERREITPALNYIVTLHDGIDNNEELTAGVLTSLIHLLSLTIFRITGEDRFELGTLSMAVAMEINYQKHLESSLTLP